MLLRRAVSTPAMLLATLLYLAVLPIVLAGAALVDLRARSDGVLVRCALVLGANLVMHLVGLAGFVAVAALTRRGSPRWLRWNLALEVTWARMALALVARAFRMAFEVTGRDCAGPGPVLLLPRHASLIDTLLPIALVGGPHRMHMRYVMKDALLWDPVIDAMGHVEPSAFVHRGTRDHGPEIEKVVHLGDDLGVHDAVVLFPEGTRFTSEKRARRLAKLAERDAASHARAEALQHLLAPHFGGLFALLEHSPGTDVVFMAHSGLEGANKMRDLLDGKLLDRTVRVEFWRVPADEIPTDDAGRRDWLYDWWAHIDAWLDAPPRPGR